MYLLITVSASAEFGENSVNVEDCFSSLRELGNWCFANLHKPEGLRPSGAKRLVGENARAITYQETGREALHRFFIEFRLFRSSPLLWSSPVWERPSNMPGGDFGAAVKVPEAECEERMKELPWWEISPDKKCISRTFVAKNFAEGLKFFNVVAQLSEVEGHHPDLHLTDSRAVRIVLSTPSVQGLSSYDFNLATRIDMSEVEYSPKWMKEHPHLCGNPIPPQPDHEQFGLVEVSAEDEEDGWRQGDAPPPAGHGGVDALKLGWPQLIPDAELDQKLKAVPHWLLSADRTYIYRQFMARNFSEGIKFFNAVAQLAEEEGHHPDLHLTDYRSVTVELTTQPLKGLSLLDMTMAERIDKIDVQYSESWLQANVSPPESPELEPPKSRRSSRRESKTRQSPPPLEVPQNTATLLHSLFLVYSEAGATGLSVHEAVRKLKELKLPGLKEKAKAVQVAKITRSHPDFVPCDDVGGFALRKTLLKCFRDGTLDPEVYADEKRLEATVLEKYVSLENTNGGQLQTPYQKEK